MVTWQEVLRRLYHDLILRRSRVRVTPAVETELTRPPIFITGVYRSGTTLLRYILDSHSQICCPPETDFMVPLSTLVEDEGYRTRLDQMGFDQAHTVQKLRGLVDYFFGNYARNQGKERWADKTPEYVGYLDFINALFPEAQYLMLYRHGLDQAHSFTRGGSFMRPQFATYCEPGEDLRIGATRYWLAQVEKMLDFHLAYPEKCLQIKYEALCSSPDSELKSLFAFVDEPWEPQVLTYYEFPHDMGAEDGRVMATRGIQPATSYYKNWPVELRDQCLEIAAPMLEKLGYASE